MTLADTNTHAFALPALGSVVSSVASGIGSFFGGWWLYAIVFALGIGAGGYGAHLYYTPKLASEQVATANAKAATAAETAEYGKLATASQRAVADALKQVSDENIKAA